MTASRPSWKPGFGSIPTKSCSRSSPCRSRDGRFRAPMSSAGSALILRQRPPRRSCWARITIRVLGRTAIRIQTSGSPRSPAPMTAARERRYFSTCLPWLRQASLPRDVIVAFFDAEDLGNIDGKEFSLGARHCAANPPWGQTPAEVVVLDMVGGADMVLDIDAHILRYPASRDLTTRIFQIGMMHGWSRLCPRQAGPVQVHHLRPLSLRGRRNCRLHPHRYRLSAVAHPG